MLSLEATHRSGGIPIFYLFSMIHIINDIKNNSVFVCHFWGFFSDFFYPQAVIVIRFQSDNIVY